MAATDIRGDLGEWIVSDPCSTVKHLQFILDVTAEDAGILTQFTHKLCNIPAGHAVLGGKVVTLTSAAGAGAAIQWGYSNGSISGTLCAAGPIADCYAIGDVFDLSHNDIDSVAGQASYVTVSGTQAYLQFIVSGADLTAGKFFVDIELLDIDSNL